jgi:nicotinate-nucleotide--dimethylbenzimidazole phosphoribosyltransferase
MEKKTLNDYILKVKALDDSAMESAWERVDNLVKPPGSLGRLEEIAVQLAGIGGGVYYDVSKRCVIIMSSDNGVVEEGVTSAPQSVTREMTLNFVRGITGAAVLAKQFNAELIVVDVGINAEISHPLIVNRKIGKSTQNIMKHEAMTYNEAIRAIITGIDVAVEAAADGYKLIGAGEMGIGNTTTSAAVLCALTGIPAELATGKGAGLKEDAYQRKIQVIRTALSNNKPDESDPVDVIAKVGGYDIAAMTGVYIGGAISRVPVVIDGFISMVAALAASRLCPASKGYMIASHASMERGYAQAALALGVEPCLNLSMRLGEGSGCPIMFAVIDAACAIMRNMATFEQAAIDERYLKEIREIINK